VINDEGDIVVPVDPRYLGLWLTGLFGDPDTTDNLDGSWDHEFASGGDDLPSYTIEVGMPKVRRAYPPDRRALLTALCSRNCCPQPRRVWSRRCALTQINPIEA
jgi:hypothetical protein